jgi:pimeloyl-ACP methyl ester carboxylesterase
MDGVTINPFSLFTDDGVRIDAGYLAGVQDLCVVLGHGFTGSWHRPNTRRIAGVFGRFASVIAIDFRGHGRSGGLSTVGDREIFDIDAAVRNARDRGHERVAVVGFSMGAAAAVRHAALLGGVDAIVSVSAPTRWYYRETRPMRQVHWAVENRIGRAGVRYTKRTRVSPVGWQPIPAEPQAVADRIAPTPLLVVHGDADPYMPVEHAEKLYAAAREPKELWIEKGYGHAESAATPDLISRIGAWLVRTAASPSPPPDPAAIGLPVRARHGPTTGFSTARRVVPPA